MKSVSIVFVVVALLFSTAASISHGVPTMPIVNSFPIDFSDLLQSNEFRQSMLNMKVKDVTSGKFRMRNFKVTRFSASSGAHASLQLRSASEMEFGVRLGGFDLSAQADVARHTKFIFIRLWVKGKGYVGMRNVQVTAGIKFNKKKMQFEFTDCRSDMSDATFRVKGSGLFSKIITTVLNLLTSIFDGKVKRYYRKEICEGIKDSLPKQVNKKLKDPKFALAMGLPGVTPSWEKKPPADNYPPYDYNLPNRPHHHIP